MTPLTPLFTQNEVPPLPAAHPEAASEYSISSPADAEVSPAQSTLSQVLSPAYSEYRRDDRHHRLLDRRPNSPGPDYSGLILSSCRAGALLNRVRIVSETPGEDIFTPEQIRALMGLMEYPEDTSAVTLDQDRNEAGHICVEITDRPWSLALLRRIEDRCEREVGNDPGCEALATSLRVALHEKNPWDHFVETLPVGAGFFVPGALAAGLGMLARILWNRFRGGPPSPPPGTGPGETPRGQGTAEAAPGSYSRTAVALGVAVAADRGLSYLAQNLPRALVRIGAIAEMGATAAAGALFAPISIRPSCDSDLGLLTNPQCEGGA